MTAIYFNLTRRVRSVTPFGMLLPKPLLGIALHADLRVKIYVRLPYFSRFSRQTSWPLRNFTIKISELALSASIPSCLKDFDRFRFVAKNIGGKVSNLAGKWIPHYSIGVSVRFKSSLSKLRYLPLEQPPDCLIPSRR
jgi:hypothetical protein